MMILTAGGRVVVEVQSFHDQRVRPLNTDRESINDSYDKRLIKCHFIKCKY